MSTFINIPFCVQTSSLDCTDPSTGCHGRQLPPQNLLVFIRVCRGVHPTVWKTFIKPSSYCGCSMVLSGACGRSSDRDTVITDTFCHGGYIRSQINTQDILNESYWIILILSEVLATLQHRAQYLVIESLLPQVAQMVLLLCAM